MELTLKVEGLDELRRVLRRIADDEVKAKLKAANKSLAQLVVDRAEPNVPVRFGRLRRSVRALASQADARAVAGGANVPYAAAIHWGRTRGGEIKARPFLTTAAAAVDDSAAAVYREEIDDLLKEVG